MFFWQETIPSYLLKKSHIKGLIYFTATFALAFINIYEPFGLNVWYGKINKVQLFFYSSLIILTGVLVVVVSRIIMYQTNKKNPVTYMQLTFHILSEILGMAAFYTLFGKVFLADERIFLDIFRISTKNTLLVLLLPYTLTWLFYSWRDKTEKLQILSDHPKERVNLEKMIPFHDEKGTIRLSVTLSDLLYLEASDNYVVIYYKSNQKVSKFMIRNTLKNLEDYLKPFGIMRCHRSYLVNFNSVKVLRREKEGLFLELNTFNELRLPVSKTYVSDIVESLTNN